MRNILTGYLRDGSLDGAQISRVMDTAENALAGSEHIVPSSPPVPEAAGRSRLSAYDCEFVVLASVLAVQLVTADKAILKAFPELAMTMDVFVAGQEA